MYTYIYIYIYSLCIGARVEKTSHSTVFSTCQCSLLPLGDHHDDDDRDGDPYYIMLYYVVL